jgi:hypothetical protein
MKTEDLITQLVGNTSPVRPLRRPWTRGVVWFACAVAYLGVAVALAFARKAHLATTGDPVYVIQQIALLGTAVTAAMAACASVVPGAGRRTNLLPIVPGAVWLATLAGACLSDLRAHGTLGLASQSDWPCVISMTVGGAVLWGILAVMLRRGAPMTPRLTGVLSGIAALSIANIEACLTRPHPFNTVVLVWHGLTSIVLITLLARVGQQVWRWPVSSQRHLSEK